MDNILNVTVLYVGTSLLAPLKQAEREINRDYALGLSVAAHNFGATFSDEEWRGIEHDLSQSDVLFVIHVMDGENGSRLISTLEKYRTPRSAVVVINCMPDLMRRTRMGQLDFSNLFGSARSNDERNAGRDGAKPGARRAKQLVGRVASWMGEQARAYRHKKSGNHAQYLKIAERLPALLRLVPSAGRLRDFKNYLYLFCYFLQPTPANIRSMLLCAIKNYAADERVRALKIKLPQPEAMPTVGIYHPDAPKLFGKFEDYRKWHERRYKTGLDPEKTIGLLLMRPQVVSNTRKAYDGLIRAIEDEGLQVLPALSTLMDNREACEKFFVDYGRRTMDDGSSIAAVSQSSIVNRQSSRVSQIVSLTGFSFVGGPAMNDSAAAAEFLLKLNRPFRSAVSLDMQTIESWNESQIGLNPVQAGMQVAIPEIDGATEPFIYGGIPARGCEPVALEERCRRMARRLKRWNRLQTAGREELNLAVVVFCFPPNKGNIGTAAELDVFPSVMGILRQLKDEGYDVEVPESVDSLRQRLLGAESEVYGAAASVAYQMSVDEYLKLCPYVEEIEREWGRAPGEINSFAGKLLIQGIKLGKLFLGVQPTFGYEGDPMRLLMARSGAPHHGFAAFYTFIEKVFKADAVIHVGTHGALEFMPGKQVGLSEKCWPDRLIDELPNIYIYSVNNPSEGSIAKRRSYAELISYLTPPVENAGLYKELAGLKELLSDYRQARDEGEREHLFAAIEESATRLHMDAN
ncbi:MAG TPA: cobaltochelatase subunit CobN [Pyrinomonadaceae bacterium]|nr:cobaltochelatase subunit CobN [Pyrinomonadaceae bacterium]